ncbi:MAG: HipA N-terminal domain-containing protein [Rhabdochlamydiaceae bacterium]|jgi:HipA-like protein
MIRQKKPAFESIAVFLEKRKTRQYVGSLTYLKDEHVFEFTYDEGYLYAKKIIPLGPEFPLTQRSFRSKKLFPSLQDRIPSKENPAYPEYCQSMGISLNESNPIILLGTIGKKGPSSFVFEPIYETSFSSEDLRNYRQKLGLTTREFSLCFDIPRLALIKFENGKSAGIEIIKRIELYQRFPEVAIFEIQRHGGAINHHKKRHAISVLKNELNQE